MQFCVQYHVTCCVHCFDFSWENVYFCSQMITGYDGPFSVDSCHVWRGWGLAVWPYSRQTMSQGVMGPHYNSLVPGRFWWNFWEVIFMLTLVIDGWGISCILYWWWLNIGSSDGSVPSRRQTINGSNDDPIFNAYFDGILPKGPYPPCLRMADRALSTGYCRFMWSSQCVHRKYAR